MKKKSSSYKSPSVLEKGSDSAIVVMCASPDAGGDLGGGGDMGYRGYSQSEGPSLKCQGIDENPFE